MVRHKRLREWRTGRMLLPSTAIGRKNCVPLPSSAIDPENRKSLEDWAREYDEMAQWAAQIQHMKRVR